MAYRWVMLAWILFAFLLTRLKYTFHLFQDVLETSWTGTELASTPKVIENLQNNTKLTTLDLAGNRIKLIQGLETLHQLEEFWCNDNQIEDWAQLAGLSHAKQLATVYLERNPIQKDVNYRRKVKMQLCSLTQIDASLCNWEPVDRLKHFRLPAHWISLPVLPAWSAL